MPQCIFSHIQNYCVCLQHDLFMCYILLWLEFVLKNNHFNDSLVLFGKPEGSPHTVYNRVILFDYLRRRCPGQHDQNVCDDENETWAEKYQNTKSFFFFLLVRVHLPDMSEVAPIHIFNRTLTPQPKKLNFSPNEPQKNGPCPTFFSGAWNPP